MAKEKRSRGLIEQLREAIRNSGEALNQLEQRTGIGRDRLSRFIRGERNISLEAADTIFRALGLRIGGIKKIKPKDN